MSGSDGAQCTTLDWPVPWCATKKSAGGMECGMCSEDHYFGESRCWDECESRGKLLGKVEEELRKRNRDTCNEIDPSVLGSCALEALRGNYQCGECSDTELISWNSALELKTKFAGVSDWAEKGYERSGDWEQVCGTQWDAAPCESLCTNLPGDCTKTSCQNSEKNTIRSTEFYDKCEEARVGSTIGLVAAIVGGSLAGLCCLCIIGYFVCFSKSTTNITQIHMMQTPPVQQMQPQTPAVQQPPPPPPVVQQQPPTPAPAEPSLVQRSQFCTNCGSQKGGAIFCGNCGAKD